MTNLVSLPTDYINVYLFVVDLHKLMKDCLRVEVQLEQSLIYG